jgi:hypothetical protein
MRNLIGFILAVSLFIVFPIVFMVTTYFMGMWEFGRWLPPGAEDMSGGEWFLVLNLVGLVYLLW